MYVCGSGDIPVSHICKNTHANSLYRWFQINGKKLKSYNNIVLEEFSYDGEKK